MKQIKYIEGVFYSKWLSKFINQWFFVGKQAKVEKIIYSMLFSMKLNKHYCGICYFFQSLEKIKPVIGLKLYKTKQKRNKTIVATPFILPVALQYKKAIFWLSRAVKLRKDTDLKYKLSNEFVDIIFNNTGSSLKKKKEHYKFAIMFKSAIRFKW